MAAPSNAGFFGRTRHFFQEVRIEGRKVTWPTRRETISTSIMVVIMVLIVMAFLFVADQLLRFLVEQALMLPQTLSALFG